MTLFSVRNSSCWGRSVNPQTGFNSTHNPTVRALVWLQSKVSFYFCSKTKVV